MISPYYRTSARHESLHIKGQRAFMNGTLHEMQGLNKGNTTMLISQGNDRADTSHLTHRHASMGAENAGQPILTLRVGGHQDPGIRRKYRPNEDTLLVTQG